MYNEKGKQRQVSHLKRRFEEEALRQQLKAALKKDQGEYGSNVEQVVDDWMDSSNTLLDAADIDFVLDELLTQ